MTEQLELIEDCCEDVHSLSIQGARNIAARILFHCVEDAELLQKKTRGYLLINGERKLEVKSSLENFVIGENRKECEFYCDSLGVDYPAFAKRCGFVVEEE